MDDRVELALRDKAVLERTLASRTINRGVALILLIPIVLVVTVGFSALFDSLWPLLVGALYTIIGAVSGAIFLALGIVNHRGAARELRQIDAIRQLPVARVVR